MILKIGPFAFFLFNYLNLSISDRKGQLSVSMSGAFHKYLFSIWSHVLVSEASGWRRYMTDCLKKLIDCADFVIWTGSNLSGNYEFSINEKENLTYHVSEHCPTCSLFNHRPVTDCIKRRSCVTSIHWSIRILSFFLGSSRNMHFPQVGPLPGIHFSLPVTSRDIIALHLKSASLLASRALWLVELWDSLTVLAYCCQTKWHSGLARLRLFWVLFTKK